MIVILVISICLLLCGCRTQYVTVPEYHTEYVNRTDTFVLRDTLLKDREVVVREMTPADSAMLAQYGIQMQDDKRMILFLQRELQRQSTQQKETVHDTIIKTDSIRVPYPVEKSLSRWQQIKLDIGEYVLVLLALLAALVIIKRKHVFS